MSTNRNIARHRAVPTRINPLVTAGRAVTAGASVAGKPAAVVVAASGLLLGAALPASAAGEITLASVSQPVAATAAVAAAPAGSYTVRSGDTLGSIAAAHGADLTTVFAANGLGYSSVIFPGQTISLSGGAVAQQSVRAAAPAVAAPVVAAPAASVQAPSAGNTTGLGTASVGAPVATSGIAATAMQGEGSGYVYGGTSYGAWDCSGFVQWVYAQHGINLPRVASAQAASLRPTSNPQPGDLVSQNGGSHIGIYLGNGQMISALNSSDGTKVHSVTAMSVDGYYTR